MKNKPHVPIEQFEAEIFYRWLQYQGIQLAGHIPNETYTPHKMVLGKLKRMGVAKGIPDYMIVLPAEITSCGEQLLLFVEMKRQKVKGSGVSSRVSEEQKSWIEALDKVCDVHATVSYGAEEAAKFVSSFIRPEKIKNIRIS